MNGKIIFSILHLIEALGKDSVAIKALHNVINFSRSQVVELSEIDENEMKIELEKYVKKFERIRKIIEYNGKPTK